MKYLTVCMLLSGVLATACQTTEPTTATEDAVSTLPITSPILRDTSYVVDYVAEIQSVQNVEIHSRVRGVIQSVLVDEGQAVKSGQVLFTLNDQEFREALSRAKSVLKSAQAEVKTLELELDNVRQLAAKNVVSSAQVALAEAKLEAAIARVDAAKSDETAAQLNLSYTEIRAPFSGSINRIPFKKGSLIDEGALLTTLSDNQSVFAYFHVPESEYMDLMRQRQSFKSGQVQLVLANGDLLAQPGVIETTDNEVERETGNIAIRARFANPEQVLKHGASGKVRLSHKLAGAMVIPQKATFEIQDKLYVFVVEAGNVLKMRAITPKMRLEQVYVVETGLSVNDKILYEGLQNAREDMVITPQFTPLRQLLANQQQPL